MATGKVYLDIYNELKLKCFFFCSKRGTGRKVAPSKQPKVNIRWKQESSG